MLSSSFFQISFTAALVSLLAGTRLDAKSVVVDDTDTSRITYSGLWDFGNACANCVVKPDKTKLLYGTWNTGWSQTNRDDTSFTFTFIGTSVEVRCVALDNTRINSITVTNVTYWIDGGQRGNVVRNPTNLDFYVYNQSLFTVTGLSSANHTLRVNLWPNSLLVLDYLVYDDGSELTTTNTSGTSTVTSSTSSNTSPATTDQQESQSWKIIVGVVVPIVCAIIAGVLGCILKPCSFQKETGG